MDDPLVNFVEGLKVVVLGRRAKPTPQGASEKSRRRFEVGKKLKGCSPGRSSGVSVGGLKEFGVGDGTGLGVLASTVLTEAACRSERVLRVVACTADMEA